MIVKKNIEVNIDNTHDIRKKNIFHAISEAAEKVNCDVYLVGGAVRDFFMGLPNDDLDFVCVQRGVPDPAARPGIMVAKEAALILNGKDEVREFQNFGTAQFVYNSLEVEFVGARRESYNRGSRKPVIENGTLDDDLDRRDFTINAMAICINKDRYGLVVDKFNGLSDLREGIIRTPLDSNITFSDDPLRMLRAVRFATRFHFTVDPSTFSGMKRNAYRIEIISAERIATELNKTLMTKKPSAGFRLLHDCGLLKLILPEVDDLDIVDVHNGIGHKNNFFHTLQVLDYVADHSDKLYVRWAALLHDIGKTPTKKFEGNTWTFRHHEVEGAKMVKDIFTRLRLPIDEMKKVQTLVAMHMRPQAIVEDVTDSAVRRLMFDAGELLEDLMTLCDADVTSKHEEKVKRVREGFKLVREKFVDLEERDHIRNFQPPVSGNEIMEILGIGPCHQVGIVKEALKNGILDGEIENTHEAAVKFVKEYKF